MTAFDVVLDNPFTNSSKADQGITKNLHQTDILWILTRLIGAYVVVNTSIWLYQVFIEKPKLPYYTLPPGRFGWWKGSLQTLTDAKTFLCNGYNEDFRNSDQPHVAPFPLANAGRVYIIPPKLVPEWVSLPENVASGPIAIQKALFSKYTFFDRRVLGNPIHATVTIKELSSTLGRRMPEIVDELNISMNGFFDGKGEEGEWFGIKFWDLCSTVFGQTANRVMVGLPLCRNEEYRQSIVHYAMTLMNMFIVLRGIPDILLPILGNVAMLPRRWDRQVVTRHLRPIIRPRMEVIRQVQGDKKKALEQIPDDILTSMMLLAYNDPDSKNEFTEIMMVNRMILMHFASIHTSTTTFSALVYDLIQSKDMDFYIKELREELQTVLREEGGWTKQALAKLHKMDSFIKESMRMHGLGAFGSNKEIVSKGGYTFSGGAHIPQGANCLIAQWNHHKDEGFYPDGMQFDGFRFSKLREEIEAKGEDARARVAETSKLSCVSPTPEFLAFSHGKHACPGRFFVAAEMKLILGKTLLKYDLQAAPEIETEVWLSIAIMARDDVEVKMKKRVFTEEEKAAGIDMLAEGIFE